MSTDTEHKKRLRWTIALAATTALLAIYNISRAPVPIHEVQTLPRIPLTFYGFADRPAESRRIFLQDNEQIFVVRPGDTVERRYKIVAVSANSVAIEDLIQNYQQLIPLGER